MLRIKGCPKILRQGKGVPALVAAPVPEVLLGSESVSR